MNIKSFNSFVTVTFNRGCVLVLFVPLACLGCDETKQTSPGKETTAQEPTVDVSESAEEVVEIPLDQIWAYRMPGTRDIGKVEPDKPTTYAYGRLVAEILRSLSPAPPKGERAKPCFAVSGADLDALRQAHRVLVDRQETLHELPVATEVSLVFTSHPFGPYVHLLRVYRRDHTIDVYYKFVSHETEETTTHVAIIPLGKLTSGKYQVNIIRSSSEGRILKEEDARRVVCRSFSFTVVEQGD